MNFGSFTEVLTNSVIDLRNFKSGKAYRAESAAIGPTWWATGLLARANQAEGRWAGSSRLGWKGNKDRAPLLSLHSRKE
jgi:hypothetical protein